jgi:CheY-like chemotaxis protein
MSPSHKKMAHQPVGADSPSDTVQGRTTDIRSGRLSYVLVVDDEPPVREFLRRWLEGWGYAVKEAGSAPAALEVMLAEPASIMLCDIKMPGQDGLWLAERVREKWPQTAVIMATALDDIPTVLKSRQLGAIDYVLKPFGREMLRQALNRARPRRTQRTQRWRLFDFMMPGKLGGRDGRSTLRGTPAHGRVSCGAIP